MSRPDDTIVMCKWYPVFTLNTSCTNEATIMDSIMDTWIPNQMEFAHTIAHVASRSLFDRNEKEEER